MKREHNKALVLSVTCIAAVGGGEAQGRGSGYQVLPILPGLTLPDLLKGS